MQLRALGIILVVGLTAVTGRSQDRATTRYKVPLDLDNYPQKTAKEALSSVIKAIEAKQLDYLVAQLADPQFVDMRVKTAAGGFRDVVAETRSLLADDPASLKELRRFLADGQWEEMETAAVVRLKEIKNRAVFFRKAKDRWYLENRQK